MSLKHKVLSQIVHSLQLPINSLCIYITRSAIRLCFPLKRTLISSWVKKEDQCLLHIYIVIAVLSIALLLRGHTLSILSKLVDINTQQLIYHCNLIKSRVIY